MCQREGEGEQGTRGPGAGVTRGEGYR
jgi:hypothetical protein